jgi:hypothetical protein
MFLAAKQLVWEFWERLIILEEGERKRPHFGPRAGRLCFSLFFFLRFSNGGSRFRDIATQLIALPLTVLKMRMLSVATL